MKTVSTADYERNVFVNCPFDDAYLPLFDALLFCIYACGFRARCALELDDSGQSRIERILRIVGNCRFGIHDLSRVELDETSGLPRFNMPFELGLFIAAGRFGAGRQSRKQCLILDAAPFRYQSFLSDVSGQDIKSHGRDVHLLIRRVRDWLRSCGQMPKLPGGAAICRDFDAFSTERPQVLESLELVPHDLVYQDRATVIATWLENRSNHRELRR